MQLTFVNDKGQTYVIEVDPEMKLEDIMALLEVEARPFSSTVRSYTDPFPYLFASTARSPKYLFLSSRYPTMVKRSQDPT